MINKLAIFKGASDRDRAESRVLRRHGDLAEINATLSEYSDLLSSVATDRGDLLVRLSKAELKNAELEVSKTLFSALEEELKILRERVGEAEVAIQTAAALTRENRQLKADLEDTKADLRVVRGQLTKAKRRINTLEEAAR